MSGCHVKISTPNMRRRVSDAQMPPHLLRAALSLSVEPAVPGLWHQHGDHLPLGERQQSAVGGNRLVRRPRPHDSSYPTISNRLTRKTFLGGWRWRGGKRCSFVQQKWERISTEVIKALICDAILSRHYINESQAAKKAPGSVCRSDGAMLRKYPLTCLFGSCSFVIPSH